MVCRVSRAFEVLGAELSPALAQQTFQTVELNLFESSTRITVGHCRKSKLVYFHNPFVLSICDTSV
jgi:hypothetical protein